MAPGGGVALGQGLLRGCEKMKDPSAGLNARLHVHSNILSSRPCWELAACFCEQSRKTFQVIGDSQNGGIVHLTKY